MKQYISRFASLLLIAAMSLSSVVMAQPGPGRGHGPGHHSDVGRALRDIETVASVAYLGTAIAAFDDYTGIRLGLNEATLHAQDFYDEPSTEGQPGVNLGVVFGWYLGGTHAIFEPGLYYAYKSSTLKGYETSYNGHTTIKSKMHSFEIPFVFKYEIIFHNADLCLHPFAGGFMSFGCGGKTKVPKEEDIFDTFGDGDGQLSSFDAGLRFGCGLGIQHFYVEAAFDLGLADQVGSDYGYGYYGSNSMGSLYSRTVSINVGFNF